MTNEKKYKTADERVKAFNKKCGPCEVVNCDRVKAIDCYNNWLALEAEEEKPMPCYECGGEMIGERGVWRGKDVYYLRCAQCGHSTGSYKDCQLATIAHNRVCRAVAAHRREVAELREFLKEAVGEMCEYCKHQYSCDGSNCTNGTASKWRKALEGAKDEGN